MYCKIKDLPAYLTLKAVTIPLRFLSYKQTQRLGRFLGNVAYQLSNKYFKRGMQNLALASDLNLSEDAMKKILKESFQNLCITCLEIFKIHYSSDEELDSLIVSHNAEIVKGFHHKNKGFIIFAAHQSNWELIFLELSRRSTLPGIGIGKPLKNMMIYNWLLSIRQRFGGEIIPHKQAVKKSLHALKQNKYVGIIGDQALPESSYSSIFLGTRAWTSTMPAMLAYKTNCPIMPMTIHRKDDVYHIYYHPPVYPDTSIPFKESYPLTMKILLDITADNIKQSPGEWLWLHKRWKQHSPYKVKKKYRYDFIAIIMPDDKDRFLHAIRKLEKIQLLYPCGFFWIHTPYNYQHLISMKNSEIVPYQKFNDILIPEWRYQMIIDFTENKKIKSHFYKYATERVISEKDLNDLSA